MMKRRLLLLAAACALPVGVHAQTPTFGVAVEAVHLDVFVSKDGQPVEGLLAADFEVKDNGVVQTVAVLRRKNVPLQAILLFDTSGSVAGATLQQLQAAGHAFLNGLQDTDRAEIVTFSHDLARVSEPGASREALHAALDKISARGSTALFDAACAALGLADPRQGRPVIVVFSDGEDRMSLLGSDAVLEMAKLSDAVVYGVHTGKGTASKRSRGGVVARDVEQHSGGPTGRSQRGREDAYQLGSKGPGASSTDRFASQRRGRDYAGPREEAPNFLQRLSSDTGGKVFAVQSGENLENAFKAILDETRTRYVLRYEPVGVDRKGWHKLKVKVKNRKVNVRTRKGYARPAGV